MKLKHSICMLALFAGIYHVNMLLAFADSASDARYNKLVEVFANNFYLPSGTDEDVTDPRNMFGGLQELSADKDFLSLHAKFSYQSPAGPSDPFVAGPSPDIKSMYDATFKIPLNKFKDAKFTVNPVAKPSNGHYAASITDAYGAIIPDHEIASAVTDAFIATCKKQKAPAASTIKPAIGPKRVTELERTIQMATQAF